MANTVIRDILISGYLAVKGLSIINKQSITVIKKWQQLWVVLGQTNASQWLLAIYQDRSNWMCSQAPLTIYQIMQLHSFTDKQTYDGLHMFLLKFAGDHKISFACSTRKQKGEWLTAVQKALDACFNRKQKGKCESHKSVSDDDWWQLSEDDKSTTELKEFQVAVGDCSLTGNINRCRVCLAHNQGYMEVYGYSTYSSFTTRWIWQYSQLYCISFNRQTLTLTIQLYINDSLEKISWTGHKTLQVYDILHKIPGVWDCTTQQTSETVVPEISPTLVRLEESDYTSVGVFLPDSLVRKMEDWYLLELTCCQHRPQLLGQYEVQLSLTHLHLKGCNSPHCWSWELHHIKSYSLDSDQLILEVEGTSDVQCGVFHLSSSGIDHGSQVTTLYHLLQQLMIKLYLVVMIKQQLIVTRKQLSTIMNHNQTLHSPIVTLECFSCELLEGPSQDLLGHYTVQIFVDRIHVISNSLKWVWLLTELYSYKLDQEEVGGATYVTIQISNRKSAVIEQWVWSGDHMIRFYSFLIELCQLLSQQNYEEIIISQLVTVRLMTSRSITINTYTLQLTAQELLLINGSNQQVVCSCPLECINSLDLVEGKNELIINTNETPAFEASTLVITVEYPQKLLLLINKAVQDKKQSLHHHNDQQMMELSKPDIQQPSNHHREIMHQVSDEEVLVQKVEHKTPTRILNEPSQQVVLQHPKTHQIPADEDQQVSVKTLCQYPIDENHNTTVDTTNITMAYKEQTSDMVKDTADQLPEAQQQTLPKIHEIVYHGSAGSQNIQETALDPLTETQLSSLEVMESKQLPKQTMDTALTQQTEVQEMSLKYQQVSFKREIALQPSLKQASTKESNQNTKLDEVEEFAHESDQAITEAEVQQYTTKSQQVMCQSLVDSTESAGPQDNMPQTISLKSLTDSTIDVLQASDKSQLSTQTDPQNIIDEEIQEVSNKTQEGIKYQLLTVVDQQMPDQMTLEETHQAFDDEKLHQNQYVSMENREIVHRCPNIQQTSTELQLKPAVHDTEQETIKTVENFQMLNESTDGINQKISHQVTEETNEMSKERPQAQAQQYLLNDPQQLLQSVDARSSEICNTQGTQQLLNKTLDELQTMHAITNEGINQPIKIRRTLNDVEQTFTEAQEVTHHLSLNTPQTIVEMQHRPEIKQPFDAADIRRSTPVTIEAKETSIYKTTAQGLAQETQVITQEAQVITQEAQVITQEAQVTTQKAQVTTQEAQVTTQETSDDNWQQVLVETKDVTSLVKSQQIKEVKENAQTFLSVDTKLMPANTENTTHQSSLAESTQRSPDTDEENTYQTTKQTSADDQYISFMPHQMSPSTELLLSNQQQTACQYPAESQLKLDEALVNECQQILAESTDQLLCKQHQEQQEILAESQETMVQPLDQSFTGGKDSPGQTYEHPLITTTTTTQTPIEIQRANYEEEILNEPQQISDHLLVEKEQTMVETTDFHPPAQAQLTLSKCAEIIHQDETEKAWQTSQEIFHEAEEDSPYMMNNRQLLNDLPQHCPSAGTDQISVEPHTTVQSLSIKTQPSSFTVSPNDDHQQMLTELHVVSHQPLDKDHKALMMDTHYITSLDAHQNKADVHQLQTSTLQAALQISDDLVDRSVLDHEHISYQCSSETQQISEQPVSHVLQQTLVTDTDMVAQTDEAKFKTLYTSLESEKLPNQLFSKCASKEPQSVNMYEELQDSTPVQDAHYSPNEEHLKSQEPEIITHEASVKTEQMPNQLKFNKTEQLSDEVVESIHQYVNNEEALIGTNQHDTVDVQEFSHQLMYETQRATNQQTIDQIPPSSSVPPLDEIYTASCQRPLERKQISVEQWEPQKALQQPLQQAPLETSQPLQNEVSLDKISDQLPTVELQQTSTTSCRVSLESAHQNVHETQEQAHMEITEPNDIQHASLNARELSHNTQHQVEENESQQITNQFPEDNKQQSFEKECVSINTPDSANQIPVDTIPKESMRVDTQQQEVPTGIITTEIQEMLFLQKQQQSSTKSLHIYDDGVEEVVDITPSENKETTYHFISTKPQEWSVKGDHITHQPLAKIQPKATLFEMPLAEDVVETTCPLLMETQQSVLHEISIDYDQKMVDTRKTFYGIPTFDGHHIKHQFSEQLSFEQLEPQNTSLKTLNITDQLPDETQSLADNEQPEEEQILIPQLMPHRKTEVLVETQKLILVPADTNKDQQISPPVQTLTKEEDQPPEALCVEFDEQVVIVDFTDSNQMRDDFNMVTVIPSHSVWYHYQLHADDSNVSTGEEISTCTCYCCSYHIMIKIEKVSQKKHNAVVSTTHHQYDLQSTRKAIDELLLKYL